MNRFVRGLYSVDDSAMISDIHAILIDLICHQERPPMVCAHGGDTEKAPPNTARSFHAALAAGADCVEIDAARTKDGQLVVLHVRELAQLLGQKAPRGVQVSQQSQK